MSYFWLQPACAHKDTPVLMCAHTHNVQYIHVAEMVQQPEDKHNSERIDDIKDKKSISP